MNLHYKLSNSDFLAYQLYVSSKSKLHQKRRFRTRIIVPIIYVLLGVYWAITSNRLWSGIAFVGVGLLWFIFYPLFSRWRYKRHFQTFVEENYKDRINKLVHVTFDEDSLSAKDFASESKVKGTELKELIETKQHYFIKLATNLSFIIPKNAVTEPAKFKKIITDFGTVYIDELNWEWS